MLLVKRLPWILLGLAVGIGIGMGPHAVAQERMAAPPPAIPLKFIGILEKTESKWAIFSEDNGQPLYAKEGQAVLGKYKLLKIGVDSVTMSSSDGTGVQTIPIARRQLGSLIGPGVAAQQQDQVLTDHPAAGGSGNSLWFFVSDSRTQSCWLAARSRANNTVTALSPAPPEACR